jgi:hypothetical protein
MTESINIFMNGIFICQGCFQIAGLFDCLKGSVIYVYNVKFSSNLVSNQDRIGSLSFEQLLIDQSADY